MNSVNAMFCPTILVPVPSYNLERSQNLNTSMRRQRLKMGCSAGQWTAATRV